VTEVAIKTASVTSVRWTDGKFVANPSVQRSIIENCRY